MIIAPFWFQNKFSDGFQIIFLGQIADTKSIALEFLKWSSMK